ncbi:MAG TPA: C2H2-type zinc finger protein [Lactovum miscens]|uniref:C2H2-type zinc finger protein n=1 Tax=Lactovum miscens TaxID=190387 RepID=UPI002ED94A3B
MFSQPSPCVNPSVLSDDSMAEKELPPQQFSDRSNSPVESVLQFNRVVDSQPFSDKITTQNSPNLHPSTSQFVNEQAATPLVRYLMKVDKEIMNNSNTSLVEQKAVYNTVSNFMDDWRNKLIQRRNNEANNSDSNSDRVSSSPSINPLSCAEFRLLSAEDQHVYLVHPPCSVSPQFTQLSQIYLGIDEDHIDTQIDLNVERTLSAEHIEQLDNQKTVATDVVLNSTNENSNVSADNVQVDPHPSLSNALSCHVCGKVLVSTKASKLAQHLETHAAPVPCEKCGKSFAKRSLILHVKNCKGNSGERFICSYCSKSFKSRKTLQAHFRLHRI